jgi:hypothetical protein
LKFIPHRLWQNKASGSIDGQGSRHGIDFTITIAILYGAENGCRAGSAI